MGMRTRTALSRHPRAGRHRLPPPPQPPGARGRPRAGGAGGRHGGRPRPLRPAAVPRRARPRPPPSGGCAATSRPPPAGPGERVAALGLADVEVADDEDVLDPAGTKATSTPVRRRAVGAAVRRSERRCAARRAPPFSDAAPTAVSRRAPSAGPPRPGRPCAGPASAPPRRLGVLRGRALRHEAPARPLGHADDPVGQQPAVVVVEPGVDERVDGLGDGVLDGAQGPAQLLVVGVVAPVEQPELGLVADDEAEVGGEAQLDLLAGAVGLQHGAPDGRAAGPGRWSRPAPGRAPASRRSAGRAAVWSPRPPRRCRPSSWPGSPAGRRARARPRTAAGAAARP